MSGSDSDIKEAHYYKYDKNSNITEEKAINAYGQANGASYEETRIYDYDSHNRLVSTNVTKLDSEGEVTDSETMSYEYDVAGNKVNERTEKSGGTLKEETAYKFNEFNQLVSAVKKGPEGEIPEGETAAPEIKTLSNKTYTYDNNGNQIKESDSVTSAVTNYSYDADNRLVKASGTDLASEQQNEYNGFGQRTQKKEGSEVTNYFYDGTSVLYTTDSAAKVTAFNLIGAEDNILSTARPVGDGTVDFYTYTKDIRESTINLVGSNGQSAVSYSYDDYGETTTLGGEGFYNEVCYGAGIYDKTTGLYYLNARYYSPETGNFLTQDTYRGDRSRTATLNLYGYCAGNPINYTDPSGHCLFARRAKGDS